MSRGLPHNTFFFFDSAKGCKFDSTFDDRVFHSDIYSKPLEQVSKNFQRNSFRVEQCSLTSFEAFGKWYKSYYPLDARVLLDKNNCVWMSDHPQERMMMYTNAIQAHGSTLVGGLGLGMFPQYAQYGYGGFATRFTIVEQSKEVINLVRPLLESVLKVPFTIVHSGIEEYLLESNERFDTIFLNTWETLEPRHLPTVNSLRNAAVTHIHWGGRILLWGYRWIIDLFNKACLDYLSYDRARRTEILAHYDSVDPASAGVLHTFEAFYSGYPFVDMRQAQIQSTAFALKITV
jgi:hypothetical protein